MKRLTKTFFILLIAVACVLPGAAEAKRKAKNQASTYNPKYSAFVVDGDTGKILYQENAGNLRHPASLTKMMTLYMLFEAMSQNKIGRYDKMDISEHAAGMPKTNLGLVAGDTISVNTAIKALVVHSANDAAVVVSEALGGTEANFGRMMTQRAKQLGMKNTKFVNASGLHDPKQITTAKDMAVLAIALKKHYPEYFDYFSETEVTVNGVDYTSHNRVMKNYPGADGMKTGYVRASGFNLVTTANRRGTNLVGVVLGGKSGALRDQQMVKLLDDGFMKAEEIRFAAARNPSITTPSAAPEAANTPSYNTAYAAEPESDKITNKVTSKTFLDEQPKFAEPKRAAVAYGFVPTPKDKPRYVANR